MTATALKEKAPLTLRDAADVYVEINRWIEEHVDELELNGGALPDELAALLDEADVTLVKKADAIAAKLDEFTGYAATAKATKDRSARREKVWNNAILALKAYALHQLHRLGRDRIRGASSTLREQVNSAPAVECLLSNEQLLDICDYDGDKDDVAEIPLHPLMKYCTIRREVVVDKKRLGADYLARRKDLEGSGMDPLLVDDIMRQEFPAISVTRGSHLRVD